MSTDKKYHKANTSFFNLKKFCLFPWTVISNVCLAIWHYFFPKKCNLSPDGSTLTILKGSKVTRFTVDFIHLINRLFYKSRITSIVIQADVTIDDDAFANCTSLATLTIADGVTIGKWAFYKCTNLATLTIADGVTIGEYAFWDCTSLTSIVIPEGVTSIGNSAFNNCTSLTSIVIPEGVTSIGNSAFWGCTGLTLYFGVSISQLDCNIKQVSSKAVEITKIIQEMDTYKFLESIEKPLGLSIFYSTWGGISKCYHKLKDKERERVLTTLLSLYRLRNIAKLPPLPIEDILPFIFKPVVDNRCDYASIKQTVKPDRQVATVKRCI